MGRTNITQGFCKIVIATGVLAVGAGCASVPQTTAQHMERGYIVMLPGIEGHGWQLHEMGRGLRDAGVDQAIRFVDWGGLVMSSLDNLTNLKANRARAAWIAEDIRSYQSKYPDRPVTVLGYSGGGGLAILTLESLKAKGGKLDRVILCAAAVSPRYPLHNVIDQCEHGIINFYSERDWWTLGIGTRTLGTIDRVYTRSAGHVGFHDADGELLELAGLTQIHHVRAWSKWGHPGTHLGWLSRAWAREVLAGFIVREGEPPA